MLRKKSPGASYLIDAILDQDLQPVAGAPGAPAQPPDADAAAPELLVHFRTGESGTVERHALSRALGAIEALGFELIGRPVAGASGGEGVQFVRVGLGASADVDLAIRILSKQSGVAAVEHNSRLSVQVVSNDPAYANGSLWGMYGDASPGYINANGSQAAETWVDGVTGSMRTVVGVIDEGIDYRHPDLYLNMWLNPGEVRSLSFAASLVDADGDRMITFRDLNDARNAAWVRDGNANGRIDAGDLLSDSRWENGVDGDGNGYVDDLVGWDFLHGDNDPYEPADGDNHGTHVAGTIGASGGDGVGVAGVNWTTQLMALKFMGSGGGYLSGAIAAMDYYTSAAARATGPEIFVGTSNSWGGGGFSSAMHSEIVQAGAAGLLFVAAAGNAAANNDAAASYPSGYSTQSTLGYETVISVAAIGSNGALASFSNYGATTVDLGAPGVGIVSTVAGGGYGSYSGTSMATPHVTGAAALYASQHPDATAAEIRAALLGATVPTAGLQGKTATGGRLDVSGLFDAPVVDPAPTVTGASPADGSYGAAPHANIVVTFSENITRGAGAIELRRDSADGALVEALSAARVSVQGATLTLDPSAALAWNTRYFVRLADDAVRDAGGNSSAAVATYDFTTDDWAGDRTSAGVVPLVGAITGQIASGGDRDWFAVSLTAGRQYTFSLDAAAGSTGTLDPMLSLYNAAGTLIAANDDATGSTLNARLVYAPGATGTYWLEARDVASAGFGGFTLAAAQTGDAAAPVVATFGPADGSTGVSAATNITLTFDESIQRGTGAIELRAGSAGGTLFERFDVATSTRLAVTGNTLTIDPTNTLAQNTAYYVVVPAGSVRDLAGNAYAGTSSFDFRTGTSGTDGNDTLTGGSGADTLLGLAGDDVITGAAGTDAMDGGHGSDVYVIGLSSHHAAAEIADTGTTGVDEIRFAASSSTSSTRTLTLFAQDGGLERATIGTGSGATASTTGSTALNLDASRAPNGLTITGNNGVNVLTGTAFADVIHANAGNDTVLAGAGDDRIAGGRGADALTGGSGRDVFVFAAGDTGQTSGFDRIQDFAKGARGVGDLIDYTALTGADVALAVGGAAHSATSARASIDQSTGVATFASRSGTSMSDALSDIAASFTAAGNAAGEFALFRVGTAATYHLFVSDGVAGVGANDVVVQLVGITGVSSIDLADGNLGIVG